MAFLLALDTTAIRGAIRDDDIRYRAVPSERLWNPREVVPGGLAEELLGVRDDLAFRRAVQATRLSNVDRPGFTDAAGIVNRNTATALLTDIAQHDSSTRRRSAAANLLGVLSFSESLADYANRERLLSSASGRFRQAIELDPSNADAKVNLELTLSRSRALKLSEAGGGNNPTAGGRGARGAGAGQPGSGY
jgi:hypothetical protein